MVIMEGWNSDGIITHGEVCARMIFIMKKLE